MYMHNNSSNNNIINNNNNNNNSNNNNDNINNNNNNINSLCVFYLLYAIYLDYIRFRFRFSFSRPYSQNSIPIIFVIFGIY